MLDRKAIITDDTTAQPGPMIASYQYVGRDRVARRDYGNNTTMTYTYDGNGSGGTANPAGDSGVRQIVGTAHMLGAGVPNPVVIDQRSYTWDQMYNKTQRKDTRPNSPRLAHDYTYDPTYRLTHTVASIVFDPVNHVTVWDTGYNLDGVHNRLSVDGTLANGMVDPVLAGSYTMNIGSGNCTITDGIPGTPIDDADLAMNQYTTTPLDARTYDRNGNLTRILGNDAAGNAIDVSCLYDYRNRMVEYSDNISGQRHTYSYDALGRRIVKTIDADGVAGGPTTTRYYYGGESQWQLCEERKVDPTINPPTYKTTATYVYGRYIDEVLQMQLCGTGNLPVDCGTGVPPVDYYYHTDDLFNVMAVTDANGTVVERYEYGDYGTPQIMAPDGTVLPSSTIGNPYLFTGRRFDPETMWYCYRTRYLDPTAGRFTTRDVIGIWGDPWELGNAYAYVSSNPNSFNDSLGLSCSNRRTLTPAQIAYRMNPTRYNLCWAISDLAFRNCMKEVRNPSESGCSRRTIQTCINDKRDMFNSCMSGRRTTLPWWARGGHLPVIDPGPGQQAFVGGSLIFAGIVTGGLACFSEDTEILMADGSTKKIKDIEVDDMVLCDEDPELNNGPEKRRVIQVFEHDVNRVLDLIIESDDLLYTITTTPEHAFYAPDRGTYVAAGELPVNSCFKLPDGCTQAMLVGKSYRNIHMKVYNFHVEKAMNYYVVVSPDRTAAILVHNSKLLIGYQAGTFLFYRGGAWLFGHPGAKIVYSMDRANPFWRLSIPAFFSGKIPQYADRISGNCFTTMCKAVRCALFGR